MRNRFILIMTIGWLSLTACDSKKAKNFSILADANVYSQDSIYEPRKIDVLWVIDNSGSMQTSQDNLAANFRSFIEKFQKLKFDYHIAVTGTDAWKTLFDSSKPNSRLRDGGALIFDESGNPMKNPDGSFMKTHSGVFVIDRNTPDMMNTFVTNAVLGAHPLGDERAFQSIQASLLNPDNSGFRRDDAFLAIIIVSDEDDFSNPTTTWTRNAYDNPLYPLYPIQDYVDFLDGYTSRPNSSAPANYSVSTITIQDEGCKATLASDGFTERIPGQRYMQLAEATGGTIGSLCSPFDETLTSISDSIVNYSSIFPLTRIPIVNTIKVQVNGVLIQNDEVNGWTYREKDNSIWFHGTSTPPSGSNIRIDFDPVGIKL